MLKIAVALSLIMGSWMIGAQSGVLAGPDGVSCADHVKALNLCISGVPRG